MRINDLPGGITLAAAMDGPAANAALSAAERRECEARHHAGAMADYRASRLAVRRATLGAAGLREQNTHVSCAHSGGRAVAVATPAHVLAGVDLEPGRSVEPSYARLFLTAWERRATRDVDLTAAWCMKEAAWKMLRCDDTLPFHALEVSCTQGIYLHGESLPGACVLFHPWCGWIGVVAWCAAGTTGNRLQASAS